ncbi:hypothetical protein EYF80_036234 [Liparis tanakae]|uniref:Uncharacterized protein n=1 Tax=Liparis tanakae TaxID=230148 RepID=A0A4Z2GL68_9TELE|nr:hypothetical protein EYF80_036234 [Liparis tanakae]
MFETVGVFVFLSPEDTHSTGLLLSVHQCVSPASSGPAYCPPSPDRPNPSPAPRLPAAPQKLPPREPRLPPGLFFSDHPRYQTGLLPFKNPPRDIEATVTFDLV